MYNKKVGLISNRDNAHMLMNYLFLLHNLIYLMFIVQFNFFTNGRLYDYGNSLPVNFSVNSQLCYRAD